MHKRMLLNIRTAADVLDMSPGALRGRVQRREIPVVRVGRRVFFDRQRLEAWIRERTEPATAERAAAV
jgi:excisionase family DNA binding protein